MASMPQWVKKTPHRYHLVNSNQPGSHSNQPGGCSFLRQARVAWNTRRRRSSSVDVCFHVLDLFS
jgi:hypothetical protein